MPSTKSIDKYLEELKKLDFYDYDCIDLDKLGAFLKSSLLAYGQEVRKEVLGIPYNISEWKKVGIERKYWDYFKKEVLEEVESQLLVRIQPITKYCGPENSYKADKLVRDIINSMK